MVLVISNDLAPTPSLCSETVNYSLEHANDFHLRGPSKDHGARMLSLVVGFDVNGNQRFTNFLLDRLFKAIANVMRG